MLNNFAKFRKALNNLRYGFASESKSDDEEGSVVLNHPTFEANDESSMFMAHMAEALCLAREAASRTSSEQNDLAR